MIAAIPEPSSVPPAVETCWKLPNKPRRFCGAHSTMKAVEVPHSPPAASPCTMRKQTSRIGAEAADHDAAERPRQEADAIGREGGEQRGGRIAVREEFCRDQPGEIGIDAEIVPLEQVADRCGPDRLAGVVRQMRARRGENRSFRHWITQPCIFAAIFHMTIRAESRGKARAMTALR